MPYLSDEQKAIAREMDLLTYLERYEPGSFKKTAPNEYRLIEHDSFVISNGKWRWCSRGFGGKCALDYLVKVHGMAFYDAAIYMLNIEGKTPITSPKKNNVPRIKPCAQKSLILPAKHEDNNQAMAYLVYRGIYRELAEHCAKIGIIYETVRGKYHNCVFVGRDKTGNPRFAAQRGIGTDFKQDASGSDKRFNFSFSTDNVCKTLNVYEGAIDALSDVTMHIKRHDELPVGHYLALGGISPGALDQYLGDHPEISSVRLRLDRDPPGREAAAKMAPELQAAGYKVEDRSPLQGKDCNEELMAYLAHLSKHKSVQRPQPTQWAL